MVIRELLGVELGQKRACNSTPNNARELAENVFHSSNDKNSWFPFSDRGALHTMCRRYLQIHKVCDLWVNCCNTHSRRQFGLSLKKNEWEIHWKFMHEIEIKSWRVCFVRVNFCLKARYATPSARFNGILMHYFVQSLNLKPVTLTRPHPRLELSKPRFSNWKSV